MKLRLLPLGLLLSAILGCQTAGGPMTEASEPIALSGESPPSTTEPLAEDTAGEPAEPESPTSGATALGRDVFARINRGLGPNVCASAGETWQKRYAGNPRLFSQHLQKILPLLDFVSIEVERAGLPGEFVFIPLVESWYRPDAMGAGGPAGMWQMIASTSRNHGIRIQQGYDGRLSPVESTRAALSYLKTLQGMFGNWQAIVMAYNAGEGRLMQAFRRSSNRDVSAARRTPHGLSNVTYDYVAKLQALSCLVAEPGRHALILPNQTRFVPLAAVLVDGKVHSIEQFAAAYGKDAAELRRLNPGYKSGRIVDGVPRLVLTPFYPRQADASQLQTVIGGSSMAIATSASVAALDAAAAPTGTRKDEVSTHQVKSGESLWSIARHYRVSIERLRRVNGLGKSALVRPGQTLKLFP